MAASVFERYRDLMCREASFNPTSSPPGSSWPKSKHPADALMRLLEGKQGSAPAAISC